MRLLAPLKLTSFRNMIYGRLLVSVGNAFRFVAIPWLIYRVTDSPLMLGLSFFLRQITAFIFTPLSGVWADKLNPKKYFLFGHFLFAFIDLTLGTLALIGWVNIWVLLTGQLLLGLFNAIEMPVRQIMIHQNIEDKSMLVSGISLNGALFQTCRILFPSFAGITINYFGNEGVCILLNGILVLLAIYFYSKTNEIVKPKEKGKKTFEELKIGFKYSIKSRPIFTVITLTSLLTLLTLSINVLFPVLSKDVFLGDAKEMGVLISALGVGGIMGSLLIGNRKDIGKLDRDIIVGAFGVAIAVAGLGISSNYYLSLLFLVIIGLGKSVVFASTNTIIQSISAPKFRSRVLGLYITSFMGAMMIGSILMGSGADYLGVQNTLIIGGCICFGLLFLIIKNRKPLKFRGIRMYKLVVE